MRHPHDINHGTEQMNEVQSASSEPASTTASHKTSTEELVIGDEASANVDDVLSDLDQMPLCEQQMQGPASVCLSGAMS